MPVENWPAKRSFFLGLSSLVGFASLAGWFCLSSDAHAGQTTFHRDLRELSKELDATRGPEVYATLRRIWNTWDRADPSHVQEVLLGAEHDAHLGACLLYTSPSPRD